MSEFTKGPWVITDMGTLIQEGGNKHHPIEVAGLNIAHFSDYGERNHRKANAILISAAPDMYEALRELYVSVISGDIMGNETLSKAYHALAKAEGKN